jgi:hypothetical protein
VGWGSGTIARRTKKDDFCRKRLPIHTGSVCTSGDGPGLQNQSANYSGDSTSSKAKTSCGPGTKALDGALGVLLGAFLAERPDLALVVEKWDRLSETDKATIAEIVDRHFVGE